MKKLLMILFVVMILISCNKDYKKISVERFMFGTLINITTYTKDEKKSKEIIEKAFLEIKRIDEKINNRNEKSIINQLNLEYKIDDVDEEVLSLIKKALEYSELTNGKFDITLLPVFKLWGFEENKEELPNKNKLENALKNVDYRKIKINNNRILIGKDQKLDLGSFIKGYAISKARKVLEEEGLDNTFISAVSSIETIGGKPNNIDWKIGLEDPRGNSDYLKVIKLKNKAMGVSGDYQTYINVNGKRYHHILNAKTGYPVSDKRMLVVIAENSFIADLLSTSLFTININDAIDYLNKNNNLEGLIVDKDMKIHYSKNMKNYID